MLSRSAMPTIKVFAWNNEDVQPPNAGVVCGLALSGHIETL